MLKLVVDNGCSASACPSVYATDRGTYIVQGNVVGERARQELTLPAGETAVEIPQEMLLKLARLLRP